MFLDTVYTLIYKGVAYRCNMLSTFVSILLSFSQRLEYK